jgi:hypothetical protein
MAGEVTKNVTKFRHTKTAVKNINFIIMSEFFLETTFSNQCPVSSSKKKLTLP